VPRKEKVLPLIQAGNGMADDHSTVGAFNNSRLILRNHKEELNSLSTQKRRMCVDVLHG
jgi:hypothetical protein